MTSKSRQQRSMQYAAAGYGGGLKWRHKDGTPESPAQVDERRRHNEEIERRRLAKKGR
jgi:hypothetical protein